MHLDDLQAIHHKKPKHGFRTLVKEVRIFAIFFLVVAAGMLVVTNFNLFASSFNSLFDSKVAHVTDVQATDVYENNSISSIAGLNADSPAIQELIQSGVINQGITDGPENFLISKIKDYPFDFNTLPPVNKMLIPSLGLDVPIIEPTTMTADNFIKANFDAELNSGVVKYPTTPDPGSKGNSLIFGHTSQEFWKKNEYGTIFKGIPKLVNGDTIKVIREGNLYEYKVVDKFVVPTTQVNTQYMSYQNAGDSYITLMGCYPLGTDKKRIMVVAKLVE